MISANHALVLVAASFGKVCCFGLAAAWWPSQLSGGSQIRGASNPKDELEPELLYLNVWHRLGRGPSL